MLEGLAALGDDERASIRRAQEVDAAPGDAEAALAAYASRDVPDARVPTSMPDAMPKRRQGPVRRTWIAAAAVLVFAYLAQTFWLDTPRDPSTTAGDVLLGPGVQLVHPRGEVDEYAPFDWNAEGPDGGFFVVRVRDLDDPSFELVSPRLTEGPWTPDQASELAWPARIRWTVEFYSGKGVLDPEWIHSASARLADR